MCVCVWACGGGGRGAVQHHVTLTVALDADGEYFLWHRSNYENMGCFPETAVRQATVNLWLHKLTVAQVVKTFPPLDIILPSTPRSSM